MFKITDGINDNKIEFEYFKFPGGELHFKVKSTQTYKMLQYVEVITDLNSSDDIMMMCLMADYFKSVPKTLRLMYTPYARQDRETSNEEPFSFKTMARLINSCGFGKVVVYDPHSDVTPALIENCEVVKRVDLIYKIKSMLTDNMVIVSPDAGAMKANHEVAKKYIIPHICATKIRDISTGQIISTQLHTDMALRGKDLLILDDICDGGRTFIELAKVLAAHHPSTLHLFVTVGIYSKGVEVLTPYFDSVNQFYKLGEDHVN